MFIIRALKMWREQRRSCIESSSFKHAILLNIVSVNLFSSGSRILNVRRKGCQLAGTVGVTAAQLSLLIEWLEVRDKNDFHVLNKALVERNQQSDRAEDWKKRAKP
ncbi:hypothetical protein L596_017032 [Steinernema carpocapsae]|uniref:Uncharacterized protein n=1 Tax=Steinernema carpocapsae TaxID=34508 RepID=A0A4U5N0L0_STECR|nr:hypothetical protein L596_017032 [Steinernema carpocapsae]